MRCSRYDRGARGCSRAAVTCVRVCYSPEVGEVMDRAQSSDSLVNEAVQQSSPNASVPPPRRPEAENGA